jgi:hypothetical protein
MRFRSDNIFIHLKSLAGVSFRNILRGSTYARHKCHDSFFTFLRTPGRILQMTVRFRDLPIPQTNTAFPGQYGLRPSLFLVS